MFEVQVRARACCRSVSARVRREWSPGLSITRKDRRDRHRLGRARGVSEEGNCDNAAPCDPIRATPIAGRYVPLLAANVDGAIATSISPLEARLAGLLDSTGHYVCYMFPGSGSPFSPARCMS
jgi:hypothetical protein